ncbi:T9SS type A sorting domain-containing protein [bacterium]|nr:T9SS type A sorting domain-containing protein [bacterium]
MHLIRYSFSALLLTVLPLLSAYAQGRAGIALEYDSTTSFHVSAGERIMFSLHAINELGNTVENWDQVGGAVLLTAEGSHAMTDSSTQSWNARPRAYTWLELKAGDVLLDVDSVTWNGNIPRLHYKVPASVFSAGYAPLAFTQSGADAAITLSITPTMPFLHQVSPTISVSLGALENYLVEITSQTWDRPDNVFLKRRYEAVVTPRDAYMNIRYDNGNDVMFTARFDDEFDAAHTGADPVFTSPTFVEGPTNVFIVSTVARPDSGVGNRPERQWLGVYSIADTAVKGRSTPYAVLNHPPNPFALVSPPDGTSIELGSSKNEEIFQWELAQPVDPCTDVRISRFDPSLVMSDKVVYEITFVDAQSLTHAQQFSSENNGLYHFWYATHKELHDYAVAASGNPDVLDYDIIWSVKATDGLYTTASDSTKAGKAGRLIKLNLRNYFNDTNPVEPTPSAELFTLHQNYPNPFTAQTTISLSMKQAGNVQLHVFNLLGEEVAQLYEGQLPVGTRNFTFNAEGLPAGVYTCVLESTAGRSTRRMLLR